jgi:hypothetical protein
MIRFIRLHLPPRDETLYRFSGKRSTLFPDPLFTVSVSQRGIGDETLPVAIDNRKKLM